MGDAARAGVDAPGICGSGLRQLDYGQAAFFPLNPNAEWRG